MKYYHFQFCGFGFGGGLIALKVFVNLSADISFVVDVLIDDFEFLNSTEDTNAVIAPKIFSNESLLLIL